MESKENSYECLGAEAVGSDQTAYMSLHTVAPIQTPYENLNIQQTLSRTHLSLIKEKEETQYSEIVVLDISNGDKSFDVKTNKTANKGREILDKGQVSGRRKNVYFGTAIAVLFILLVVAVSVIAHLLLSNGEKKESWKGWKATITTTRTTTDDKKTTSLPGPATSLPTKRCCGHEEDFDMVDLSGRFTTTATSKPKKEHDDFATQRSYENYEYGGDDSGSDYDWMYFTYDVGGFSSEPTASTAVGPENEDYGSTTGSRNAYGEDRNYYDYDVSSYDSITERKDQYDWGYFDFDSVVDIYDLGDALSESTTSTTGYPSKDCDFSSEKKDEFAGGFGLNDYDSGYDLTKERSAKQDGGYNGYAYDGGNYDLTTEKSVDYGGNYGGLDYHGGTYDYTAERIYDYDGDYDDYDFDSGSDGLITYRSDEYGHD